MNSSLTKHHEREVTQSSALQLQPQAVSMPAQETGSWSVWQNNEATEITDCIVGEKAVGRGGVRSTTLASPPSLSKCHNCNEPEKRVLSGSQAKTAFALRINAQRMIDEYGLNCAGFLTLTVGDHICPTHGKQIPVFEPIRSKRKDKYPCPRCGRSMPFVQVFDVAEASRRIHSLSTGFLRDLFALGILVSERHASSAIHFHMLGILTGRQDIRSGFDFGEVRHRNYRSVSAQLKAIWQQLRYKLPLYGFGRAELTPVRKTGGAVASYVSKYIEKHVTNRHLQDRRKKLVRYHGFNRCHLKANDFEWDGENARVWRSRARSALNLVGISLPDLAVRPAPHVVASIGLSQGRIRAKCLDGSRAREVIGSRWAYKISKILHALEMDKAGLDQAAWPMLDLLSREMQRLAGRAWCVKFDTAPVQVHVMLGEEYTRREWREYWQQTGSPMPTKILFQETSNNRFYVHP